MLQHLLAPGPEGLAVHRAVEKHRRDEALKGQPADEGDGFPMPVGDRGLYGGGFPDPLSNAEQLSYLFFFYLLEGIDADNELKAKATKQPYVSVFAGDWTLKNPLNAPDKKQTTVPATRLRWSTWARGMTGEALVRWVRDEVFPFYTMVAERSAMNFMDGARLWAMTTRPTPRR